MYKQNLKLELAELKLSYRELVGQKKRREITVEDFNMLSESLEQAMMCLEMAIDNECRNPNDRGNV